MAPPPLSKSQDHVCTVCTFTHYPHITCMYLQKRGSLKGQVDLTKVKAIEKVQVGQFDKPSFQVNIPSVILYDQNLTSVRTVQSIFLGF